MLCMKSFQTRKFLLPKFTYTRISRFYSTKYWVCCLIRWNSSKLLLAVDEGNIEIWECQSPGNSLERISYLTGVHHDMALSLSVLEANDHASVGDVLSGGGDGR